MENLLNEKVFRVEEGNRIIKGLRQYLVYAAESISVSFTIKEKGGFLVKMFRVMLGEGVTSMRFEIYDAQNNKIGTIKKGFGVSNVSVFKLFDKNDKEISSSGNPLKFNDDSFIEVKNIEKQIIFKSGLTGGSSWFPILVFSAENTKSDWLRGTISGTKYAHIGRTDNRIFKSGNKYTLTFMDEPGSSEALLSMLNFVVCADFYYDN